jgi:acetolactate synthase I/II/III large subunit
VGLRYAPLAGLVGMKASDLIVQFLMDRGVRAVFEMSGGMITHLLDSLCQQDQIEVVSMHHEQGAGFAADAYGRITRIPGVALATSGPGATNLLTAIGSCYFDSSPAIFITGQVNRLELKGDRPIRQLGFQETDIVSIVRPIAKAAWAVRRVEDLPAVLASAFDQATTGRPGPVLIDIPMDVQREDVQPDLWAARARVSDPALPAQVKEALHRLRRARRPLIVAGGGVRAAGVRGALRDFARREAFPVVYSLMAVDAIPFDDPLHVGMLGSYGNRWVNLAIARSDAILVLGSRLDIRQTGSDVESWRGKRFVVHVDCDPAEINNRVKGCQGIECDLATFFEVVHDIAPEGRDRGLWLREISDLRHRWPDTAELAGVPGINPNAFMHELSHASTSAAGYVVDVGQHQMWAAQSLELQGEQRFITSGGMGAMGFALPAAVGAAIATGGSQWVVVAGDGGFQSNIQELQTVVRKALPLKIVVLNNRSHGMVRQFQETYFGRRYQSTVWGYSAPDFEAVAKAYGIDARTVARAQDLPESVEWLWSEAGRPNLLQVMIDTSANVYPKIAFGRPMTDMEPEAQPIAMEGT